MRLSRDRDVGSCLQDKLPVTAHVQDLSSYTLHYPVKAKLARSLQSWKQCDAGGLAAVAHLHQQVLPLHPLLLHLLLLFVPLLLQ